jgi:hypothetical protein
LNDENYVYTYLNTGKLLSIGYHPLRFALSCFIYNMWYTLKEEKEESPAD